MKYKIHNSLGFMRRPFVEIALKRPDNEIKEINGVTHIQKHIIFLPVEVFTSYFGKKQKEELHVYDVTFNVHPIIECMKNGCDDNKEMAK